MKKYLVPVLCAIGGVGAMIPAVVGPLAKREPIDYTFLVISLMFFIFAGVFFAIGRKPSPGSGSPTA